MVVLATILGTICVSGRIGLLTYYIIYVVGDYTVIASVFTTMTVVLLAAAGYVAGAEQTDSAKAGINAVVNLVPLVIGLLSLVPLIFYKLNPAKVAEIHADLDAGKHQGDK